MTHLRLETLELSNVGRRGLDCGSRGAHKMEKRTKEDVEEESGSGSRSGSEEQSGSSQEESDGDRHNLPWSI